MPIAPGSWAAGPTMADARLLSPVFQRAGGDILAIDDWNTGGLCAKLHAGSWSALASMINSGRRGISATMMPIAGSGDIIAADGGGGSLDCSRYSLAGDTWTDLGLFPGIVLPFMIEAQSGLIVWAGGESAATANCKIFDPATNLASSGPSLNVARNFAYSRRALILLADGKILAAGGFDGGGVALASCERLASDLSVWTATGSMINARAAYASVLMQSGKVLVIGGQDASGNAIANCEIFDPTAGTWSAAASFPVVTSSADAVLLPNGMIFASGGYADPAITGETSGVAAVYNPAADTWTTVAPMSDRRGGHALFLYSASPVTVIAIGGESNDGLGADNILATTEIWTAGDLTAGNLLSSGDPAAVAAIKTDAYGTDILFTDDFKVTPSRDWQLVSGLDNLRRAVYRRLITRPGEYKVRPEYGCGVQSYVKKALTSADLDALRHRIIDNLLQDPRVEKADTTIEQDTNAHGDPFLRVFVKVRALGEETDLGYFNVPTFTVREP